MGKPIEQCPFSLDAARKIDRRSLNLDPHLIVIKEAAQAMLDHPEFGFDDIGYHLGNKLLDLFPGKYDLANRGVRGAFFAAVKCYTDIQMSRDVLPVLESGDSLVRRTPSPFPLPEMRDYPGAYGKIFESVLSWSNDAADRVRREESSLWRDFDNVHDKAKGSLESFWGDGATDFSGRILQHLAFSRDVAIKDGITQPDEFVQRAFDDFPALLIPISVSVERFRHAMPKAPHTLVTGEPMDEHPFEEFSDAYTRIGGEFRYTHKDLQEEASPGGFCMTQYDLIPPENGIDVIDDRSVVEDAFLKLEKRLGVKIPRPRDLRFNSLQLSYALAVAIAKDTTFYIDLPQQSPN